MGKQGTPTGSSTQTSSYLLQHAYNLVDWYPWGPEALERARAEDKPILLSVGYAACHWCHVMAHESFEGPETAALMNRLFVCVKVDREERPDLDGIYMDAVQAMTGQDGWPIPVFLTPRGSSWHRGRDRGTGAGVRGPLDSWRGVARNRRETPHSTKLALLSEAGRQHALPLPHLHPPAQGGPCPGREGIC